MQNQEVANLLYSQSDEILRLAALIQTQPKAKELISSRFQVIEQKIREAKEYAINQDRIS